MTLPVPPPSKNQKLQRFDLDVREGGWKVLAGVDEAGRGPLAGPVVSAAVIVRDLSAPFTSRIDDSKKLSALARAKAFEEIQARCVVSVSLRDSERIDEINIYEATLETMREAVDLLPERADLVLIDGPIKLAVRHPIRGIIGGDALSFTIACASITAKVTRDRMMEAFDAKYPEYGFKQHKGYGTAQHLAALREHGPCPIHRRSFAPVRESEDRHCEARSAAAISQRSDA